MDRIKTINKEKHPCFNFEARNKFSRVHLPVAPKCNIQCNFCNRKYSCVNESRPGVTSTVLSPSQAVVYFDMIMKKMPSISVMGIAGPGDAFANAQKTLETMRKVRERYPFMLFCLSTNGLNVLHYFDDLMAFGLTHLTITVNAVKKEVGAKIYAWVLDDGQTYCGEAAAELLMNRQLEAIEKFSKAGVVIKVNCILLPGVNDHHVEEVALRVSEKGANIFNCMPVIPVEETVFEKIKKPLNSEVRNIREKCSKHIKQMTHCQRCRADAAGLLKDGNSEKTQDLLSIASALPDSNREFVDIRCKFLNPCISKK
ncbi:MAG: nitrogenase cofactor biosynthesis protein NifB [Candidatus Omnitrophica bacterium]|nr:nitrogenase cofactor biosynthesis protein NifB [Candidatus Omnitrophota bacterium]